MDDLESLALGRVGNVDAVLKQCAQRRSEHRDYRKGYTNDKGRTGRMIAEIPLSVWTHPVFRHYFDDEHDMHERIKHVRAFLAKFPSFLTVDKL